MNISMHHQTAVLNHQETTEITATFSNAIHAIYKPLPIPSFMGSNSWVIGADKTKNGKVIFANDPHIGFSQPSVWYQSHIKTPDYEMYGFNLALTPFPLLGHNRKYAYGLTMFQNDDIDFYFEEQHPFNEMEYKTPTGFVTYDTFKRTIKIKDNADTTFQVKVSGHGPLMNTVMKEIDDTRPVAMQWIYTKLPNRILEVSHTISHANSLSEFKEGIKALHAPGLNVMYGDAENNIAWFAAGKLYKYGEGVNSKLILNGTRGEDEIAEYLDFEENPQAVNPGNNYVYPANNEPDTIAGIRYPGYYLPEDRANRIVQLLEAKNDFTKEEVAAMLFDVTSDTAPEVIADLLENISADTLSENEKKGMELLKNWNGAYTKKSVEPVIYNRFLYEFLTLTFKDELGKGFYQFMNTPLQKKMIAIQASKKESLFWDDIFTKAKETKQNIITASFKNAIVFLENQLGHTPSE